MSKPIDAKEIYQVLPHRYPMCLLDRVIEVEPRKRAVGIKHLTPNEPFFQGHFPQEPVMPGVLQIEALAQLAGWLFLHEPVHRGKRGYLRGVKDAKFRRPVRPGDQLKLEVEVLQVKREQIATIRGKAYVGEELVAQVDLTIVLNDT